MVQSKKVNKKNNEVAKPAKAVKTPTKKVAKPAKAVETPTKKVAKPAKAVETPTKKVAKPAKAVETPTKKVAKPAKAVETPTKKVAKPAKAKKTENTSEVKTTPFMQNKAPLPIVPIKQKIIAGATKKIQSENKAKKKHVETHYDKALFMELLKKERDQVLGQYTLHKNGALTPESNLAAERAGLASHIADLSSESFQHEIELGLMSFECEILEMIEDAIDRLESNDYGYCFECGKEIGEARLRAKPHAQYCLHCASLREKHRYS